MTGKILCLYFIGSNYGLLLNKDGELASVKSKPSTPRSDVGDCHHIQNASSQQNLSY
jgi:hypothetical protein